MADTKVSKTFGPEGRVSSNLTSGTSEERGAAEKTGGSFKFRNEGKTPMVPSLTFWTSDNGELASSAIWARTSLKPAHNATLDLDLAEKKQPSQKNVFAPKFAPLSAIMPHVC